MAKPASYYHDIRISVKQGWCKGCGICTLLCTNKVLMLDTRGKAMAVNPTACTGCGKCESHCPDFAIMVERHDANERLPLYTPKKSRSICNKGHENDSRA